MHDSFNETGVLFVRRFPATSDRPYFKGMSSVSVMNAYRGIDGEVWPEDVSPTFVKEDGLLPLERWSGLLQLEQLGAGGVCDAIVVAPVGTKSIDLPGLTFLGYEVGFFESGYNVFSSILHECISGRFPELRGFGDLLNKNLLFDNHADAQQLVDVREELRVRGRGVEDDTCYPMAIFGSEKRGLRLTPDR